MIPNLSKTAFWDVNFDGLDAEKDAGFIMEKVFNYGNWDDNLTIIKYYGKQRIRQEVIKGAYFKKKVLSFLCTVFDLQPTDFTCYIRRQSHQVPWNR
jgi:hypothetical protein